MRRTFAGALVLAVLLICAYLVSASPATATADNAHGSAASAAQNSDRNAQTLAQDHAAVPAIDNERLNETFGEKQNFTVDRASPNWARVVKMAGFTSSVFHPPAVRTTHY